MFERLAEMFPFIELDVYSSFKLYGWEERDKPFQELFERCKQHPRIRYHAAVPYEEVVKAYQQAHIFAYPSIWPETSCRCLIESMMAGCLCVHPNFAALPDTCGGLTNWYDGSANLQEHGQVFAEYLAQLIHSLRETTLWQNTAQHRLLTRAYAMGRFGWPSVIKRWQSLISELKFDAAR